MNSSTSDVTFSTPTDISLKEIFISCPPLYKNTETNQKDKFRND